MMTAAYSLEHGKGAERGPAFSEGVKEFWGSGRGSQYKVTRARLPICLREDPLLFISSPVLFVLVGT